MKTVTLDDALFAGAISLEKGDGWIQPWRIPHAQRALFCSPNEILLERASNPAGVRLRFATGSRTVKVVTTPHPGDRLFDLTIAGDLVQTASQSANDEAVIFSDLPDGEKTVEIWLPQRAGAVQLRELSVDDGADAWPVADGRPKWVTYGSSISHCGSAHSPARIWPAVAARGLDWDLTCLGFGGNCHLEPMCARMIRDREADVISLKLGINVMGGASLGPRTFKAAVIGLVQIVREKHPDTPIAVISPIVSPPRELTDNAVGLNLTKMRVEIEDAVARIKDTCGDENLHYFDGRLLFDESLAADYLPDDLHPNGDGYEIMGKNFAEKIGIALRV